jgi:putative nucleotidyltransferase with HDIG domain
MFHNPDDLLRGYVEVSSLPMIYYKINEAISNPRSSMADISKIISDDPGLTVRLLRIVNSAFYGFPSKIETITQALVIIGTNQLRDLALATSIMNLFEGIPKDLVSMESFWRHSIACGIAAKTLATYRNETNIERFLVAGMLHDIGRLILYKKASDQAREALLRSQNSKTLLFLMEQEVMGFDHASLGRRLLEVWNLPPSLGEAVAFHHKPHQTTRYPVEAAIVHVADIIVNALRWGSSGEYYVPPLEEKAWELIGLSTGILSSALESMNQQMDEITHSILQDEST